MTNRQQYSTQANRDGNIGWTGQTYRKTDRQTNKAHAIQHPNNSKVAFLMKYMLITIKNHEKLLKLYHQYT